MTTRLATPRNFVLSTTTATTDNCTSATITSAVATSRDTLHHANVENVLINEVDTINTPTEEDEQQQHQQQHQHFHFINDEAIESAAQLQEVLNHQRKLSNGHEGNDVVDTDTLQMESQQEVAVISVVLPMDATDSNSAEENSNIHLSAIKDNVDLVQQVANGQVTVVQAQPTDSDEGAPHYITVTVSAQDAGQNYQVQYVDTELYQSNSSQTQMTYPFCPVTDYQTNGQTTYYSTASGGNYASAANSNTPTTHATTLPYLVPVDENLLLNSSSHSHSRDSPQSMTEVAYIQEAQSTPQTPTSTTTTNSLSGGGGSSIGTGGGGASPDCERNTVSNTNKIALATVKWLSRNYETADGVSLPRSTLYNHYIQHCNECKLEPVNAASFGKLIRSVFTGLRTRRLGTRGNSKYHYYGIRVKPGSILNHIMDDKNTTFSNNMPGNAANNSTHNSNAHGSMNAGGSGNNSNHGSSRGTKKLHFKPETYEACAQFLGDGAGAIPPFPAIELEHGYHGELTRDDVETFRAIYREHCESFLDAVLNLEFATIEYLWRDFWRNTDNNNMEECGDEEKFLSMNKSKLYLLCQCAEVQKFIKEVDYQFYQNMVDVIIPDVLRSIPNALTQAIRNFAKNLEIWLCESMVGVPERFVQIKTAAVSAFCQTLRRYTSLNHLAQAARAVLQNSTQISQMLSDLNRVDFHNVQEQAAWVCQCEPAMVQRLESDFKAALQQQSTLEQWASWLQLVVDSSLQEYRGKPSYAKAARQFLLKWSFYSSMVIRDLTLRSASSFGSFHLIRLLYDEYMFYLVEHKIAEAQQKTAIAVLCDRMKKDVEFDFEYQLDLITNESEHANNSAAKRLKHE